MSRLFLEQIERHSKTLDEWSRMVFFAATLLHDVGHGPFSHAFEKITKEDHEQKTQEIVTNTETEVFKALNDIDPKLPEAVRAFQSDDYKGTEELPKFFRNAYSSQLDADRFDYLLRDSYSAGVNYGSFEHTWLISHLYVSGSDRLYLSKKAILAAEAYVFARHHMYQIVYFHKTTRAAEAMFRSFLTRYKHFVSTGKDQADPILKEGVPEVIRSAFTGEGMSLKNYLQLDDHSMTHLMKVCANCSDTVLKELGHGLLNRKFFKCEEGELNVTNFKKYEGRLMQQGKDPDYFLLEDKASDTPYKTYKPDSDQPESLILVESDSGTPVDLSSVSEAVSSLARKKTIYRLYFPESVR